MGSPVEASLTLTLAQVTYSQQHVAASPTTTTSLRVDLRTGVSGREALVTPAFGEPAVFSVTETAAALILAGSVKVRSTGSAARVTDTWTSLVLDRQADGSLAATARASGTTEHFSDDYSTTYQALGAGSLAADTTAPSLRIEVERAGEGRSRIGPPDALLPWDRLRVRSSEGLDWAGWSERLTAVLDPGASSLPFASIEPTWAGVMAAGVALVDWDAPAGTLTVASAAGAPDRAGNLSPALSEPRPVLAVPAAAAAHRFDEGEAAVARWGATTVLAAGAPACEQGGCVQLGPQVFRSCDSTSSGLAGRVQTTGKTRLTVRYRVWSALSYFTDQPLSAVIVRPGGSPSAYSEGLIGGGTFTEQPGAGDYPHATDWLTASFALPTDVASDEAAFVVQTGCEPFSNFPTSASNALVIIDRIEAE